VAEPAVSVTDVEGQRLAVILVDTENDEQTLLVGEAQRSGDELALLWHPERRAFPIPAEALSRLRRVDQANQEVLDILEGAAFLEPTGVNLDEAEN
jgi:hypothetical protein